MNNKTDAAAEQNLIPDIIWHYTDLAGFLHIMQAGSWFYGTHYRHLSDKFDCMKGEKIFDDCLADYFNIPDEKRTSIITPLVSYSKDYSYYIGCFSAKKSSTKLWNASNFCVGFDSKKIMNVLNEFNVESKTDKNTGRYKLHDELINKRLISVLYKEVDYKSCITQYIEDVGVEVGIKDANSFNELFEKILKMIPLLSILRYRAMAILKLKKFRYENEKRVVYYVNDQDQRIEWIRGKPRIKLFQINNDMIKHIYVFDKYKSKRKQYYLIAQALCQLRSIDPKIVSNRTNKRD